MPSSHTDRTIRRDLWSFEGDPLQKPPEESLGWSSTIIVEGVVDLSALSLAYDVLTAPTCCWILAAEHLKLVAFERKPGLDGFLDHPCQRDLACGPGLARPASPNVAVVSSKVYLLKVGLEY